jgi:pimeloyl-ACP methyl ester carboxylesterase
MSTITPTAPIETKEQASPAPAPRGRRILHRIGRWLKWLGIALVALVLLGVAYQTIATELDKRTYSPRGQLYTVNGHQMHIVCMGEGSPVVLLQAGGAAESLWWYWVQKQLAEHTRVCAYDRPGHGWSEPTSEPRDALTIVGELHALLEQAGTSTRYVMAGHSLGAVWTRVYAAKYPEEVIGIILVDSTFMTPREFANWSEFDQWKTLNNVAQVVVWGLYRAGLVRLSGPAIFQSLGYPPDIASELVAMQSRNQVFDADYAEQIPQGWAMRKASAAAENLGDLPMAVLWAGQSDTAREGFVALREEIAGYSSNSVTRDVEGANHGSILGTEQYAQQVSDAILDVIEAAQTGEPLAQ